MNKLKKLILTMLLLSSTSLLSAGFDTPMEAFNFYIKLAVKANAYEDKYRRYKKEHVNALAPHMYSKRNPTQDAIIRLSHHGSYVQSEKNDYRGKEPMVVSLKVKKPYFGRGEKRKGILTISYAYFKHQHSGTNYRRFYVRAKKMGNKIKWFVK